MGGDHADRPARLPVSSGDTEMELQPLQGSGSGDPSLMAQRWTDDPERGQNGAHAAGERKESRSQLQSRRRRELAQRWAARERCTVRAAVVAVASLALILVGLSGRRHRVSISYCFGSQPLFRRFRVCPIKSRHCPPGLRCNTSLHSFPRTLPRITVIGNGFG